MYRSSFVLDVLCAQVHLALSYSLGRHVAGQWFLVALLLITQYISQLTLYRLLGCCGVYRHYCFWKSAQFNMITRRSSLVWQTFEFVTAVTNFWVRHSSDELLLWQTQEERTWTTYTVKITRSRSNWREFSCLLDTIDKRQESCNLPLMLWPVRFTRYPSFGDTMRV